MKMGQLVINRATQLPFRFAYLSPIASVRSDRGWAEGTPKGAEGGALSLRRGSAATRTTTPARQQHSSSLIARWREERLVTSGPVVVATLRNWRLRVSHRNRVKGFLRENAAL